MADLSRAHLQPLIGAALVAFVLFGKLSELRMRRRAVHVTGQVIKIFSHRHATSYFVRYTWQGAERSAEYRGAPLRQRFAPNDSVELLVDPALPDVEIPDDFHNAPGAGAGGGTCSLAGERLWTGWDALYLTVGVILVVRGLLG